MWTCPSSFSPVSGILTPKGPFCTLVPNFLNDINTPNSTALGIHASKVAPALPTQLLADAPPQISLPCFPSAAVVANFKHHCTSSAIAESPFN